MTTKIKTGMKRVADNKNITLIFLVIAVVVLYQAINGSYLSSGNIRTLLGSASVCGVLAVGLTCLMISGQIDLSSASVGCLGGVLLALMLSVGIPWPLALLFVVLFGALTGAIVAFFVNVLKIPSFITTIAVSSVYQGLARFFSRGQSMSAGDASFWTLGDTLFDILPVPFLIMTVLFIVYGIVLSKTRSGRRVYICGGNSNAARLAGINTKKIHAILFINNGAIAAFAGCLLAARMHSATFSSVIGTDIDALTAIILGGVAFSGGKGSMVGSYIGLLLLNCFKNGLIGLRAPTYWQIIAQGLLFILALTVDYLREHALEKSLKAAKV